MHRVLLGLEPGDGLEADHINRNKLDNRRVNLRKATRRENGQNLPAHPNAASKHRGVFWCKREGLWLARVKVNYRAHNVGYFRDEEDAAAAAAAYRAEVFTHSSECAA